jgi:hypothetical protein
MNSKGKATQERGFSFWKEVVGEHLPASCPSDFIFYTLLKATCRTALAQCMVLCPVIIHPFWIMSYKADAVIFLRETKNLTSPSSCAKIKVEKHKWNKAVIVWLD